MCAEFYLKKNNLYNEVYVLTFVYLAIFELNFEHNVLERNSSMSQKSIERLQHLQSDILEVQTRFKIIVAD